MRSRLLCNLITALITLTYAHAGQQIIIDNMEGDISHWGDVKVERMLVKQGERALRWVVKGVGDAIMTRRVPHDISQFRSFAMWVHSAKMTGARIRIEWLAPDERNGYGVTFTVDWRGWNRMEVPMWSFKPFGKPYGLNAIRALRFSVQRVNLPDTVLCIDDISVSTEDAKMPIGENAVVIDCQWRAPFQNQALWRQRVGNGTRGGIRSYWCWLELWYRERAGARDVISFERTFNVDVTEWDELDIRICQDREGFLTVRAIVDGRTITLCSYKRGTGAFVHLRAPLNGRQLEKVIIDVSEPPNEIGGTPNKQVIAFLQYVALLRKARKTKLKEVRIPMPRERPEPLETAGLPFALYFSRADLPKLRDRAKHGIGGQIFEAIKGIANRYVNRGYEIVPREFLGGGWGLAVTEGMEQFDMGGIIPCAFTYLITGDARYADVARRAILSLCAIEHWCEGELARYPLGWGGFGNPFREADCARTIAPAYDWIYNTLSDEERKFIEDSLREKALYWLDDCVKFRFPANMNQGAVFGSGYALAVLVLRNRYRDIEPLVQRALDAMHRVCALYFGDDGWAPEGFGYWAYTMNTAITALTPLARATKIDIRKWLPHGLRRGILYPFHMRSLASQTFAGLNFNDAHYRTRPPSAVLLFYATVLGDARARWLWEQIYGEAHPPADFLSFLWCEPTVKSQPARLEHAFRFGERSATFLRTGAQFGETLFALQTSGVRQGHYHRDRNSFIIEAFGERLVVDAGQISYSDPTHQELKKARLHNTVTADDIDQDFPKAPYVVVQRLCTTPAIDYIRADATNAYSRLRRSVRHVVFLRPATFVMIDEIAANEPVSASFNMMLLAPPRVNGATVRIMKRRAKLLCRIAAPMDVEPLISQWRTDSGTGHHISLRTQAKAREHTLVTALVAMPKDAREPSIKPLTVSGGIGVAIAHGDARDIVAFRTSTREMRMSEFSTDARVVAIRFRNENVRAVALCDGTRLTTGDFAVRTDKVTSALVHLRHRGVLVIGASGRDGATITVQLPEGAFTRQFMHRATALCRAANSKWREVGVRVNAQRRECAIRLPSADDDWCIAVVNPPSGMSLDDYASPRITSVSVDGMVFDTTAEIYIGAKLPRVIRVEVEDDESAIDESALALICDGRVVRNAVRIISKSRGGKYAKLECRIPHELQLPPTDGAPLMRRFILRIGDFGLYPHTAQIAFVHHSPMRIAKGAIFLSDLKPVRAFSHGGVKRDCDYFGDELSVAGMHFKKGLLIHPEVGRGAPFAEVVYDLTKLPPRRWFIAVVGIEDDASMRGSVTFCVEVLRNGDWQRIYESPVTRRIDGVRFVRVNIVGAKMLRLLCTDAGDSINSDHAVWGLARLE